MWYICLHVHCYLSKDEKERTWDLFNVLVVPDLAKRLISMDELNSFGHEVTFIESTVEFRLSKTQDVLHSS